MWENCGSSEIGKKETEVLAERKVHTKERRKEQRQQREEKLLRKEAVCAQDIY